MAPTLDQICCASVPLPQLATLAGFRREPAIRMLVRGDRAWVRWPVGHQEVLRRLFPVSGVCFFARNDNDRFWYALGQHLPTLGIPRELDEASVPLASALVPASIDVSLPQRVAPRPARIELVRNEEARPASALRCRLNALSAWAETVPSSRLKSLHATLAGDLVMVLGSALPVVTDGTRYWGTKVLIPLGFRTDPSLSEDAIRRALNIASAELLWFTPRGYEVVSSSLFRPLTLAGIRLAGRSLQA
ncbi:hypothetical protein [Singulisphaera acidiphila]|uniref:MoxR-vWA-beta-propeller ternary system domain-containing protein n=1 Tax=Singulisphaera acidiphila (strain ATCC BAA-1392 / DSM 18658 / VKM B-2454 / MOB10) TaxID=886293 RepID=L0DAQ6_SINAD|nr:hypothetical protein [Singulisphaera acidiphila]AGA26454.1 hypothetical protein Sinac_2119 [Singulisphaera acidiphila DSM 18658]